MARVNLKAIIKDKLGVDMDKSFHAKGLRMDLSYTIGVHLGNKPYSTGGVSADVDMRLISRAFEIFLIIFEAGIIKHSTVTIAITDVPAICMSAELIGRKKYLTVVVAGLGL